ncbi:hypothetical protein Tco_0951936 [Tanacetum coccineum]|uniref:DUF4283 domain-containing protein n=1 Tax=Tanacetum coccineum TaxID=301880 RepID=A0ABQ5DVL1_9ASTR
MLAPYTECYCLLTPPATLCLAPPPRVLLPPHLVHFTTLWNTVVDAFIPLKESKSWERGLALVKEFASLTNIKLSLNNEGFMNLKISYMGEKWIMLEFVDSNAMNLFRENVSVGSWFSQIIQASTDFISESRIAWVEIEGIQLKLWSENTFKRIATKWGEMLDIKDQEDDCFHSKRICVQTNSQRWILDEFKIIFRGKVFWIRAKETPGWVPDFTYEDDEEENSEVDFKEDVLKVNEQNSNVFSDVKGVSETLFEQDETSKKLDEVDSAGKQENTSEDPFNLYPLLKKKSTDAINQEPEVSLKYPPGFTPKAGTDGVSVNDEAVNDVNNVSGYEANVSTNAKLETGSESACSGHFKKSDCPRSGGSILDLLDDVVKVRKVMGFNMDGCMNNMEEIIKSQGVEGVHR